MMPEPTLGAQILASAMCLHIPAGSDEARGEWATLRSLCARADAAERLAVVVEWCDDDGWEFASDRYNQYHEALAAWRAITEEAQP